MGTKSPVLQVFWEGSHIGDLQVIPAESHPEFRFPGDEIRIERLSHSSDRCIPLAILHTISPSSVLSKLRSPHPHDRPHPLAELYHSLFQHRNTAVVPLPETNEELHLVAMPSRAETPIPSFWCCSVRAGLYNSCLGMLNLRCLAIVFDLDETLIVANTMKSFEDRIDTLTRWIDAANDPARISAMSAELKRYLEDRDLLKQYIETNTVRNNGKIVGVQNEEVLWIATSSQDRIVRPIIRLPERNTVLTRINPEIRDTSVLVRLRPAWEELRSYLTAKGRKRFEVFVCTMAERDYALEMWRLLDPEAHLISSKEILDRVVCVKSGTKKSLVHVFQEGNCHPKMTMVIDDRLKVWDDKDQPRVHVVPAFAPYYAPQAETASPVPVLCVARNVACNVRGGFFKEFDEKLMQRIFELSYENDVLDLPFVPDVSYYLMPEDTGAVVNHNKDLPISEGISGAEVEKRLDELAHVGDELPAQQQMQPPISSSSGDGVSADGASVNSRNCYTERESVALFSSSMCVSVLQEIGRLCQSKVEFKSAMNSSKDLHFSAEVFFSNEKIGSGLGKTRKEAQAQAAENALQNLASDFVSFMEPASKQVNGDLATHSLRNENGFLCDDSSSPMDNLMLNEDSLNTNEVDHLGPTVSSEKFTKLILNIKKLCPDGQSLIFQDQADSVDLKKEKFYFQVEVSGRVLGKAVGESKEDAMLQAAEEAYKTLIGNANQPAEE